MKEETIEIESSDIVQPIVDEAEKIDEVAETDKEKKIVPKKLKITKEEMKALKEDLEKEKAMKEGKPNKKDKPFKWSWAKRRQMDKSVNKPDQILFFVINLKRELEGPVLTRIYGGNFLVKRNRVYRYNPKRIYSMGKYKVAIGREFDRELVGIDDFDEVVAKGEDRSNINDPVLIKALLMAHMAEKPQMKSSTWIIIAVAIVAAIGAFMYFGGQQKVATPQTTATAAPSGFVAATPAG